MGRSDAAAMASAYRFLRAVEHLLQLRRLRRTHLLPEDPAVLREIGRAMRRMRLGPARHAGRSGPGAAAPSPAASGDPAAALAAEWRLHAGQARQLHEKLFYRPLLDAVARLPGEVTRLTPEAARDRLEALGYADPAGALRHIEALTAGVSRKAAMQRTLLPVLLGWLADAPEPDAGLLAFRQVSEALGRSPWYLRLLRDNAVVAQRMARLLASSRYAAGLAASRAAGGGDARRRRRAGGPAALPSCWPRPRPRCSRHDTRGGGRARGAGDPPPGAAADRGRRRARPRRDRGNRRGPDHTWPR